MKERWFRIYEEKLTEAEERGLKHPEDWAAEEASQELREQMAVECDRIYDSWKDREAGL